MYQKGEHSLSVTGGRIKFYVHNDIKELSVLPVLFHGAIDRHKIIFPFFEARNTFSLLNKPAISFFDPVVEEYADCNLAWFAGNDRFNTLQRDIYIFLKNIVELMGVRLFLHGGSGGGFAALVQQFFFGFFSPHIVLVQNPQTSILNYYKVIIDKYFSTYSNIVNNDLGFIFNSYNIVNKIYSNMVTNVLYFQNIPDRFHVQNHFKKFIKNENLTKHKPGCFSARKNHYFLGTWGEGHQRLPKEIVLELFSASYDMLSIDAFSKYIQDTFSGKLNFMDINIT